MKKLNKKGFTIVELVIVISVIAILSAVMIPTFTGIVNKAKNSAALQNAKNAYTAYLSGEEFDYAEEDKADLYMIYENEGRYAVVIAGVLSETIYTEEADAKAALGVTEANEDTYDVTEEGGFDIYTLAE